MDSMQATVAEEFECPRRKESPFSDRFPGPDRWRADGTCSHCGSLSPEKFFAAIEAGAEVGPTDKSYKAYINVPHPDPEGLRVVGSTNGDRAPGGKWEPATAELRARFPDQIGENTTFVLREKNGPHEHHKFYFQHLSGAERTRFIELYNSKRMKIGYPGYFYTRPFFCAAVAAPAEGAAG